MVREGRLTEEEAHTHPQRSIVTRALGTDENIPIDELTLDLKEGDRLLLCTDGLSSMLDRDTVQEILRSEPDPQAACDRLVEEANRAGGDDNITVVLLDVVGDDEVAVHGLESAAVQRSTGPTMAEGPDPSGDTTFVRSVPDQQEPAPPRRR